MNKTFLVAGGDLRFVTLAEKLAEKNKVLAAGFDRTVPLPENVAKASGFGERADCLVLPLPVSPDGVTVTAPYSGKSISIESLLSAVKEDGIMFGGMVSPEVRKLFEDRNIAVEDYAKREEFAVLNASATAEGALQAAMEELPTTLSGRKVLILGAGRIARVMIDMLRGFHTDITISARKCSDLAWARIFGCTAVDMKDLDSALPQSDIIFNTVPAAVLNESRLSKIRPDCLVIDLASKPGGVDLNAASMLGIKVLWLLSLPGKVAPVTSGEIIAYTINNILSERGELDG